MVYSIHSCFDCKNGQKLSEFLLQNSINSQFEILKIFELLLLHLQTWTIACGATQNSFQNSLWTDWLHTDKHLRNREMCCQNCTNVAKKILNTFNNLLGVSFRGSEPGGSPHYSKN